MSQNGQDNKCPRSSQSKIVIHFAVAAHEYPNVVGERVSEDNSSLFHSKRMPFVLAKSKIPVRAVNLPYMLTFLMTKSGMGYGVNARRLTFFPVARLRNL